MKTVNMSINLGELGQYDVEVEYERHPCLSVKAIWPEMDGKMIDILGVSDNVEDEAHNHMYRNEAEDRMEAAVDHAEMQREERLLESLS